MIFGRISIRPICFWRMQSYSIETDVSGNITKPSKWPTCVHGKEIDKKKKESTLLSQILIYPSIQNSKVVSIHSFLWSKLFILCSQTKGNLWWSVKAGKSQPMFWFCRSDSDPIFFTRNHYQFRIFWIPFWQKRPLSNLFRKK